MREHLLTLRVRFMMPKDTTAPPNAWKLPLLS